MTTSATADRPPGPRLVEALGLGILVLGFGFLAHFLQVPGIIGLHGDEAIYALAARALAAGQGFVDLARPGLPPVPRYPPGFPAWLALWFTGQHEPMAQAVRALRVSLADGMAFLVACHLYLRLAARWSGGQALLATALVGSFPLTTSLATGPQADLAFGAIALAALVCLEAATRSGRQSLPAGLLIGLATLCRYPGIALFAAALLVFGRRRAWRELGLVSLGFALVQLPWLLHSQLGGSASYASEAAMYRPADLADFAVRAGASCLHLLAALAGLVGAAAPNAPWAPAGLLVLVALAWGVKKGWRPLEASAWALAATLALAFAYDVIYNWYGELLLARLLLPLAPVILMLAATALPRRVALTLLTLGCLDHAYWQARVLEAHQHMLAATAPPQRELPRLFDAIRKQVPAGGLPAGPIAHMISFYTERPCLELPSGPVTGSQGPGTVALAAFEQFMRVQHVRYLVGINRRGAEPDHSVQLYNALGRARPESLVPLYFEPKAGLVLFEVRLPR